MHIHELNNPIFVNTPLGMGKAIILIYYGTEINSVWKVVLHNSGMVRNFYDTDIIVLPNKMDGGSIDENYFKNKKNKK